MLHHDPELLVKLVREERAREMRAIHLATTASPPPLGLRARVAAGLARAALILHREAYEQRAFAVLAPEHDGHGHSGGRRS
jgi:hypothetical protein